MHQRPERPIDSNSGGNSFGEAWPEGARRSRKPLISGGPQQKHEQQGGLEHEASGVCGFCGYDKEDVKFMLGLRSTGKDNAEVS